MPATSEPTSATNMPPNPTTILTASRTALHQFLHSNPPLRFQIIHTTSTRPTPRPLRPPPSSKPQTIAILDSSFNPPTHAHLALATSILRPSFSEGKREETNDGTREDTSENQPKSYGAKRFYERPKRLALLFSTHNATKGDAASTPASFEHRLAMMRVFAEDIVGVLRGARQKGTDVGKVVSGMDDDEGRGTEDVNVDVDADVDVDVALTTEAFYSDKSAAIDESMTYSTLPPSSSSSSPESQPPPPRENNAKPEPAQHIHLVGHDTFLRILTPRYYADKGYSPPLSALAPFFAHHGLRIMLRFEPGEHSDSDHAKRKDGESQALQEQTKTWHDLANGEMEKEGGKREWSQRIEVVEEEASAVGVSSTVVRGRCERGEWGEVERLCTDGVADWIRRWGVYGGERGREVKM